METRGRNARFYSPSAERWAGRTSLCYNSYDLNKIMAGKLKFIIEIEEDFSDLLKIAEERDTEDAVFIDHEEVWKTF